MPRPKSGTAVSDADRVRAYRLRKREAGFRERSVRLNPKAAEKADRLCETRGTDFSGLINAMIAEA